MTRAEIRRRAAAHAASCIQSFVHEGWPEAGHDGHRYTEEEHTAISRELEEIVARLDRRASR